MLSHFQSGIPRARAHTCAYCSQSQSGASRASAHARTWREEIRGVPPRTVTEYARTCCKQRVLTKSRARTHPRDSACNPSRNFWDGLFGQGIYHLESHLPANALCGPPVARQKPVYLLLGHSKVLGNLRNGFPLQALSEENRELCRVDRSFLDRGESLVARLQDSVRSLNPRPIDGL